MKTKLKLTNEVIRDVYVELCINGYDRDLAAEFVAAVRELRDRAKLVVEDADRPLLGREDEPDVEIGKKLIDALREVLP